MIEMFVIGGLFWLSIPIALSGFILRRRMQRYRLAIVSSVLGFVIMVAVNLIGTILMAGQITGLILLPGVIFYGILALLICGIWCLWVAANNKGTANG